MTRRRCEGNPPTYEHDFETVSKSWAEIVDRCKRCGYEWVVNFT